MSANPGSWTARRRRVHAVDSVGNRDSNGPRFARFAAAMEAGPPPEAQILPDAEGSAPAQAAPQTRQFARPAPTPGSAPGPRVVPPAPPPTPEQLTASAPAASAPADDRPILTKAAAGATGDQTDEISATVTPRRPVIDGRSRGDIPWLGIGSWVLFCGALFVSLLGWPDQTALDRVTGLWSSYGPASTVATDPPEAGGGQSGTAAAVEEGSPGEQDWSAMTEGTESLDRLQSVEMAPAAGPRATRVPGGPPVPQFKPNVDRVAAKFSNAFFEIGERLQREGDFDAAVHMRRQGNKLDPWKPVPSGS